jgi:hypothetical protein
VRRLQAPKPPLFDIPVASSPGPGRGLQNPSLGPFGFYRFLPALLPDDRKGLFPKYRVALHLADRDC